MVAKLSYCLHLPTVYMNSIAQTPMDVHYSRHNVHSSGSIDSFHLDNIILVSCVMKLPNKVWKVHPSSSTVQAE